MSIDIAPLRHEHWAAVERIYAAGIATGHATFEDSPPTWEQFDAGRLSDHRLVALDRGTVVGWVAASAISSRRAYVGVVEHSLYVAPDLQGAGTGRSLLQALIASTEAAGVWTIQSSIFPENTTSLALHVTSGFRRVGTRERVARMTYGPVLGHWRDTVLIERRSSTAGVD